MNAPIAELHVLAKPAGATCKLDCAYCFFLSKERLSPDKLFFTHVEGPMRIMADLIRRGRYADEIMRMPAAADAHQGHGRTESTGILSGKG